MSPQSGSVSIMRSRLRMANYNYFAKKKKKGRSEEYYIKHRTWLERRKKGKMAERSKAIESSAKVLPSAERVQFD